MLQRAAKNAYSWWWASHIRTKQSKWLEQNLQDMEEKVEYILKIVNEDGDSFAVRANMYYRKRPEIVNFVEDCFRGYRALAERYDHLSRDLQSANRAIATVYPERLQLQMDEYDEDFFTNAPLPTLPQDTDNITNTIPPIAGLPAVPKSSIPKLTKKNSKLPLRLMSKNGLLKIGDDAVGDAHVTKGSGLCKEEAIREIDKLQKGILGLQTEKEFVRSSYESGKAKYWEIEGRIGEMQQRVSSLQDEFGIGMVIEDDEARSLMSATALNSCQEALAKMRTKQKESNEQTRIERQRFHEALEKFEALLKEKQHSSSNNSGSSNVNTIKLDQQGVEEEIRGERGKPEEELSSNSLTVSELAEKIDEVVDKVISLETEVSSQTAFVTRLRTETDELHAHLKALEEDKEVLIEGVSNNKIRKMEEELGRVRTLNQQAEDQNKKLENYLEEANHNLKQLSENLSDVKPDEEAQSAVFFQKRVKSEDAMKGKILDCITFLKAETEKSSKSKKNDRRVKGGQKVDPEQNSENRMKEDEDSMAYGYRSKISKEGRTKAQEAGVSKDVSMEMNAEQDGSVSGFFSSKRPTDKSDVESQISDPFQQRQVRSVVVNSVTEKDFDMGGGKIDYIDSTRPETTNRLDQPAKNAQLLSSEEQEVSKDDEDQPNWTETLLYGLEDREKLILEEYTSTLKNYKEVRKKLSEVEKRNRASLFKSAVQIKVLRNSNALKDAEIQSLHEKLDSLQTETDKTLGGHTQESSATDSDHTAKKRIPSEEKIRMDIDFMEICIDEPHTISAIEEKIRMDIDDLLEENIEVWLRFSNAFHQIPKFQTSIQDLKAELKEIKNKCIQDGKQSLDSDVRPVYRHLRDMQTELTLWLENSEALSEDLQHRLSSLSNIQEEITRLTNAGPKEDQSELSNYRAARFQGEILNMKHENKKVADELRLGGERVKKLRLDIEETLDQLDEELRKNRPASKNASPLAPSRIPLKSFLFGVKLKKQKPSIFACMNPAMQKQYSELTFLPR